MSTPTLNLGLVSSYGEAKRGGYTGTYDQWCALLASIGTMQHALTPGYNIGIADNVISTLAPAVGENLLINSDWRPSVRVNQRGQTIYNGAVYGPDCWKGTNDAVRMQLTTLGLYLTGTDATTTPYSQQRIENPDTLLGKTVTFSAINTQGTLLSLIHI